jgi:AraC-like DNA-binding protein
MPQFIHACGECPHSLFSEQLRGFIDKCQAFLGAVEFAPEGEALNVLQEAVCAFPRAGAAAHSILLAGVVAEFLGRLLPSRRGYEFAVLARNSGSLELLCTAFREGGETALEERGWSWGAPDDLVERALTILRRRAHETDLTAARVALSCGVSAAHLRHALHLCLGVSFSRALRRHRMLVACSRLADLNVQVKEVGYNVGYVSPSRFVRDFRKELAVTPSAYRSASSIQAKGSPLLSKTPRFRCP